MLERGQSPSLASAQSLTQPKPPEQAAFFCARWGKRLFRAPACHGLHAVEFKQCTGEVHTHHDDSPGDDGVREFATSHGKIHALSGERANLIAEVLGAAEGAQVHHHLKTLRQKDWQTCWRRLLARPSRPFWREALTQYQAATAD